MKKETIDFVKKAAVQLGKAVAITLMTEAVKIIGEAIKELGKPEENIQPITPQ